MLIKKQEPYFIVNALLAGIILALLMYSGIFSATGIAHPIKSTTSYPTISTGLSRAFSEIVRFNFQKARNFNPYSLSIFLFFMMQLLFRITLLLLLLKNISKKLLLITDILITVLLFLLTFFAFITDQF